MAASDKSAWRHLYGWFLLVLHNALFLPTVVITLDLTPFPQGVTGEALFWSAFVLSFYWVPLVFLWLAAEFTLRVIRDRGRQELLGLFCTLASMAGWAWFVNDYANSLLGQVLGFPHEWLVEGVFPW